MSRFLLPDTALDQLTAVDVQLLLRSTCGVERIHVDMFILYTSFIDESYESDLRKIYGRRRNHKVLLWNR